MKQTFYQFKANSLQGKEIDMQHYEGKTIIVVNTASKCGFTPQYEGLEKLYKKYKDRGLVILGFPCNQFGNQEPGTEKDISEGCLINYGVSFPMFAKVDVNGENTHPIFTFLKNTVPNIWGKPIKWNFTKFVIDKTGKPVKRYAPITKPEAMEKFIISLL
jgi:glutathione peroxidase